VLPDSSRRAAFMSAMRASRTPSVVASAARAAARPAPAPPSAAPPGGEFRGKPLGGVKAKWPGWPGVKRQVAWEVNHGHAPAAHFCGWDK